MHFVGQAEFPLMRAAVKWIEDETRKYQNFFYLVQNERIWVKGFAQNLEIVESRQNLHLLAILTIFRDINEGLRG